MAATDAGRPSTGAAAMRPLLRQALLFIVAAAVLVPLLATVLGGFKTLGELRSNPFGLPAVWQWQNYWGLLTGGRYWQLMGNSLVIALATVALTLVIASMAAFVFAQLTFFGSGFLFNYLLLGLMFPVPRRSCRCSSRSATWACSTPTPAWCCRRWPSAWRRASC